MRQLSVLGGQAESPGALVLAADHLSRALLPASSSTEAFVQTGKTKIFDV